MRTLAAKPSTGARGAARARAFAPGARSSSTQSRPIGPWAFAGFAITSFGGPLALAALIAPGAVAEASASAGLATLAAAVVFLAPLAIWLRYARHVHNAGGLYAFVEAAAGRRLALAQAAIWTVSYLLYIVYTTVQVVYDVLPDVLPGERRYQTALALLIPVALVAVMVAGRAAALALFGLLAVGQLALAGALDGVTLAHVATPASTFGAGAPAGSLASAGAQSSLLYICGGLPLFLGGELARPVATIRRGLLGAFALTAVLVIAAVAPLATAPGIMRTAIPGVSVAQQFVGHDLGVAIGVGVAASTVGVMLAEYFALSRLMHAVGAWPVRRCVLAIGAVLLLAAPIVLIDPQGIYSSLLEPSLAALWLSQLIVFAVFPRFARRHGQRMLPAWLLSIVASGFAVYGLTTVFTSASS